MDQTPPDSAPGRAGARQEPIYWMIRRLMLVDFALGMGLMIGVGPALGSRAVETAGAILAALGLALYYFFGRLAERRGPDGQGTA